MRISTLCAARGLTTTRWHFARVTRRLIRSQALTAPIASSGLDWHGMFPGFSRQVKVVEECRRIEISLNAGPVSAV